MWEHWRVRRRSKVCSTWEMVCWKPLPIAATLRMSPPDEKWGCLGCWELKGGEGTDVSQAIHSWEEWQYTRWLCCSSETPWQAAEMGQRMQSPVPGRNNPRQPDRLGADQVESSSAEKGLRVLVVTKLNMSQQCGPWMMDWSTWYMRRGWELGLLSLQKRRLRGILSVYINT